MKFRVGQMVRVKKNGTGDSSRVAGKVGKIVLVGKDGGYNRVFFKGWLNGWSVFIKGKMSPTSLWAIASENLLPVRKTATGTRTKRAK